MKRLFNIVLLLVLTLSVTAVINGSAFALESLSIDIGKSAKLVDGGQAVELRVKMVCAIESVEVLEAFVHVTQNGNQSQFAPILVSCGDSPRPQKSIVRIPALDFLFQEGEANATAFILVIDPSSQDTSSVGDTQVIRIR